MIAVFLLLLFPAMRTTPACLAAGPAQRLIVSVRNTAVTQDKLRRYYPVSAAGIVNWKKLLYTYTAKSCKRFFSHAGLILCVPDEPKERSYYPAALGKQSPWVVLQSFTLAGEIDLQLIYSMPIYNSSGHFVGVGSACTLPGLIISAPGGGDGLIVRVSQRTRAARMAARRTRLRSAGPLLALSPWWTWEFRAWCLPIRAPKSRPC